MKNLTADIIQRTEANLQTPTMDADPRMSIQVTRARLAVMDSTYWTVETIREGQNLGDVAVVARRLRPHGRPDRLYEIHEKGGQISTAYRAYPDRLKAGWQDGESLGAGEYVAIAIDGTWHYRRRKWRMQTVDLPHLFWTISGTLYTQVWGDPSTRQELATDIAAKPIGALRGWHNDKDGSVADQGVMVAYIKTDGKVYYRALTGVMGAKVWEAERVLETAGTGCLGVRLAITIDYRMVFIVTYASGVKAYVSVRNWSGFASPTEHISAALRDVEVALHPIRYLSSYAAEKVSAGIEDIVCRLCPCFDPSTVKITAQRRVSETVFEIDFTHTVELRTHGGLRVETPHGVAEIESAQTSGQTLAITTKTAISGVHTVTISAVQGILLHRTTVECVEALGAYAVEIEGEPQIQITENAERISAGITPMLAMTAVIYKDSFGAEKISAIITPNVVLAKVGNNPL